MTSEKQPMHDHADDERGGGQGKRGAAVFNRKGLGANAVLTAAAAAIPLIVTCVAGLTSLAGRRAGKRMPKG